jgi:hypothetical protein
VLDPAVVALESTQVAHESSDLRPRRSGARPGSTASSGPPLERLGDDDEGPRGREGEDGVEEEGHRFRTSQVVSCTETERVPAPGDAADGAELWRGWSRRVTAGTVDGG